MSKRIAFSYESLAKFETFVRETGRELNKIDAMSVVNDQDFFHTINQYVRQEILDSLVDRTSGASHSFGRFMADRTYVSINATDRMINFTIGGLTEKELAAYDPDAARIDPDNDKDYNLWEMYESGQFDSAQGGEKSKKAIQKDTGGVLAIRTKANMNPQIAGSRAGLIASIVNRIRANIKLKIQRAALEHAKFAIAAAMAEGGRKATKTPTRNTSTPRKPSSTIEGINKLPNTMRKQAKEALMNYHKELAEFGVRAITYRGAGGSIQVRFRDLQTGKFTKNVPTGVKERIIGSLQ